ncbi:MAG: alginate O-acetyltransferase [Candidatus Competibacteraceae bacterium]
MATLDRRLLNGEVTTTFTDAYNRNLPFRDFAIDVWGTLSFVLFGEGRKGVLVGTDGWLYTSEEFERYAGGDAALERKLKFIAEVRSVLQARGVTLSIALVPAKARIYPEHLGRYELPHTHQNSYQDRLNQLRELGVIVPDLQGVLDAAKSVAPVFLKTDTHWTPYGSRRVAKALADAIHSTGLPIPDTEFTERQATPVTHRGDLLRFVRLGKLVEWAEPRPDTLVPLEARPVNSGVGEDLFGEDVIPVVLAGTSYSANSLWSFESALKLELGADVMNVADEGLGPIEPMVAYLRSEAFTESPPKLVVWEIPERFMAKPYPEKIFDISL